MTQISFKTKILNKISIIKVKLNEFNKHDDV